MNVRSCTERVPLNRRKTMEASRRGTTNFCGIAFYYSPAIKLLNVICGVECIKYQVLKDDGARLFLKPI